MDWPDASVHAALGPPLMSLAPVRFASLRFVLVRYAPVRSTFFKSAPLKSTHAPSFSFLHAFHTAAPCVNISTCSGLAIFHLIDFFIL